MGMYGDALNKLDDGLFIKIEPGRPVRLRILDHPHVSQRQFTDAQTGEVNISTRFAWPVWDYAQQRPRILEQGKSIFKGIASAVEAWPDGEMMPSPFDVVITRVGTGKNDTEYTVNTVPHEGTMPRSNQLDLPDVAGKTGGIPLKQVVEGAKPDIKAVGQGSQEALASGEQDTVITELDTSKPINLDDTPF